MEWNLRTPSEWDWENLAMFSSKTTEVNKQVHHEIEGGRVENGSLYSSAGAGFSSSDLGYPSSSKSSISASADSSLKEGVKTFSAVDGFPKACFQEVEVAGVDDNGNFSTLGASVNSSESMIGLKLGKRTYFENMCATGTTKTTSFSVIPTSSATTARRSRASYQSTQTPRCQVEGCNLDLKSAKDYHRRHRICETHSKSPRVIVAGLERRFCQQCSRFHDLLEFDDKKRSCRKRLSDHNARRRRPRQEARLSSSLYDGRQKINLLLNRVPSPWHNVCDFKTIRSGDSLSRPVKTAGIDRQPHFSGDEMHNSISMPHLDSGRILSFPSTTTRIPNHDLAPRGISSNSDVSPDLRHALSLLSTNSWGLNEPEPTSLKQFVHSGQSRAAQPVMHAEQQDAELASSQYLRMEQPAAMSCLQSMDYLHGSGNSQFQEFQLFKAPYESGCFYPNQIN